MALIQITNLSPAYIIKTIHQAHYIELVQAKIKTIKLTYQEIQWS